MYFTWSILRYINAVLYHVYTFKGKVLSKFWKTRRRGNLCLFIYLFFFIAKTADCLIESIIITSLLQWFQWYCSPIVASHHGLTLLLLLWPVPSINDQVAHKTHTILDLRMNPEGTWLCDYWGLNCQPMHERIIIIYYNSIILLQFALWRKS